MENKKKVFISYSHHDRDTCNKIDSILGKYEGFDVWFDRGLTPGEVFRRQIVEVIRESGYFIILLSDASVQSDWCIDEVEYAKKLHKKILPIWVENVELPDELDMILQRYHSLFWYLRSSDTQFETSLMSMFDTPVDDTQGQALVGYGNHFSEKVNLQMKTLLAKERQEKFADCYQPENAIELGKAYLFGGPCAVNRHKAYHYFKTAEYFGNRDAEFYLLEMQLEDQERETWDEPDAEFCGPIVERIRQLAEEGSVPAKLYLANMYWHGHYGVEADMVKSAALYEECARLGNARAQFVMASNYYNGEGVEQNYELAKMYANLALEQKYIYAWRRWGKFYRDGLAVPQNYEKARACYEKGAKMGDFNCYNKVADMLYHGWGSEVDFKGAVEYFEKGEKAPAFSQRYCLQRSKMALGRAYENGQGVEKDLKTASDKYLEGYHFGSLGCRDAYLRCSSQLPSAEAETGEAADPKAEAE